MKNGLNLISTSRPRSSWVGSSLHQVASISRKFTSSPHLATQLRLNQVKITSGLVALDPC